MEIDLIGVRGTPRERPINLYFEYDDVSGRPCLVNTPGTSLLQDLGDGEIRGLLNDKSRNAYGDSYAVCGGSVYKSSNGGGFGSIGSIGGTTGKVWMAMCGAYLVMVNNSNALVYYHLNTGATTSSISPNCTPSSIAVVDGYAVVAAQNTRTIYHSALMNPSTAWAATDSATIVGGADSIQALYNLNGELWVIGSQTTEVMYNAGGAGFVFAALPQGFINIGTNAPGTVVELDNSLWWLSQKGEVIRTTGYGYEVVSPPSVNKYLYYAMYSGVADARAFMMQVKGRPWYCLNLNDGGYLYVCDIMTLKALGPTRAWFHWRSGSIERHIAHGASCLHQRTTYLQTFIVGSRTDGRLYHCMDQCYTDDATVAATVPQSTLESGAIESDGKILFHHSLELNLTPTMGGQEVPTPTATTLDGDVSAGATEIVVDDATDFDNGDVIVITLDDATTFQTWQSGAAVGTTITLEESVPVDISDGNAVNCYNPAPSGINGRTYLPRVELKYSDGSGWVSLGKRRMYSWPDNNQEFLKIAWHGLGASRKRYYQIIINAACPKQIYEASLNVTVGE